MATLKLSPGKIIILLLAVVFLLGIGTIAVVGRRMVPSPYVCTTQTVQNIPHLAGAHFTVTHTQCQDYTHKQFVSVYVQRVVAPGAPFYKHWFNKPVLLFRYHPENAAGPMPTLSQVTSNVVEISVPRMAEMDDRREQWLNLTIQYHVGRVDHPLVAGRD
ncbi:MAG: hypothetical protein ACP5M4_06255 [Acidobacteriaceae bacterium]